MGVIRREPLKDPFARIPRKTALDVNIKADALGVLVYLYAHGREWEPQDADIQRRFGRGRDWMRAVWKNLESEGYAERRHQQDMGKGRLGTITNVSAEPIFTGGGLSTGGGSAGGVPTTYKRKRKKPRKKKKENQPDPGKAGSKGEEVSICESEIGVRFPFSVCQLKDPDRVLHIIFREGLQPESVRRVFAEHQACSKRKKIGDGWALLSSLAKKENEQPLKLSNEGENNLPAFF